MENGTLKSTERKLLPNAGRSWVLLIRGEKSLHARKEKKQNERMRRGTRREQSGQPSGRKRSGERQQNGGKKRYLALNDGAARGREEKEGRKFSMGGEGPGGLSQKPKENDIFIRQSFCGF